jgi:HTH-type transcriptional regulator / antitoxin HigA
MQNLNLTQTIAAWTSIAETVFVPHTEEEYEAPEEFANKYLE